MTAKSFTVRPEPNTPQAWIERAASSLALAKMRGPGIDLEDLCYQAQQAAEKALKAVFLAKGARFPLTHNLELLLQELEEAGVEIPESVDRVSKLSRYAVETRYPGFFDPVTESDFLETIDLAEATVEWARKQL
jgi:HEPN domain-containing protein